MSSANSPHVWFASTLSGYSSSECSNVSSSKCSMKPNLNSSNPKHVKLCLAVQHYREYAVSIHQASIYYQVPYTTLRHYGKNILPIKQKKRGKKRVFTNDEERMLVRAVLHFSHLGTPKRRPHSKRGCSSSPCLLERCTTEHKKVCKYEQTSQ